MPLKKLPARIKEHFRHRRLIKKCSNYKELMDSVMVSKLLHKGFNVPRKDLEAFILENPEAHKRTFTGKSKRITKNWKKEKLSNWVSLLSEEELKIEATWTAKELEINGNPEIAVKTRKRLKKLISDMGLVHDVQIFKNSFEEYREFAMTPIGQLEANRFVQIYKLRLESKKVQAKLDHKSVLKLIKNVYPSAKPKEIEQMSHWIGRRYAEETKSFRDQFEKEKTNPALAHAMMQSVYISLENRLKDHFDYKYSHRQHSTRKTLQRTRLIETSLKNKPSPHKKQKIKTHGTPRPKPIPPKKQRITQTKAREHHTRSPLPQLSSRELGHKLRKLGFAQEHHDSKHLKYKHPDGRIVIVPKQHHKDLPKGTLRNIIKTTNGFNFTIS